MPYSKSQRTLACIALSMMKGETPESYSAQAAKMKKSMTKEQLEEFCKSPVK
jgi:hypothetical protein